MKKISIIFYLCILSACSPEVIHEAMIPDDVSVGGYQPFERIDIYTTALEKIGDMLSYMNIEPIYLCVKPVTNKTAAQGKLPSDITDMVETALQSIGETIYLIPFDYCDNIVNIGKSVFIVYGAITEYNVAVNTTNSGLDFGLSYKGMADITADTSTENSLSSLAIDFKLFEFNTKRFIPNVYTSNKIKLAKKSKNNSVSFSVMGNGFGLNGSASAKHAEEEAIRTLVELSMVQLISMRTDIPYWLAVNGGKKDYKMLKRIRRNFLKLPESVRLGTIKYYLTLIDDEVILSSDKKLDDLILKTKRELNIYPLDNVVTADFYIKLLEYFPKLKRKKEYMNDISQSLDHVIH